MPLQGERCVILKVMNEDGDIAYIEEEDIDELEGFVVIGRAVTFFTEVLPGEN